MDPLFDVALSESSFGFDNRLLAGMKKLKFTHATLVQAHAWPLALAGKDLMVRARTGSGKTAAYVLPILHKILKAASIASNGSSHKNIQVLILVPTTELVSQVCSQIKTLASVCPEITTERLNHDEDASTIALLKHVPDIVVGTPGKMVHFLPQLDLTCIHTIVVDEADLVLSYGYEQDVKTVFTTLPKICQSFLMSATLSPELDALKRTLLHNAATVKLEEGAADGNLKQFFIPVKQNDKDLLLYAFIKLGLITGKVLLFVNTTEAAYRLKLFFEQFSIKAAVLNGELPFNSRQHIIEEFNRGIIDYLIATDSSLQAEKKKKQVANQSARNDAETDDENQETYGVSRGIDFNGVNFVLNVDFPKTSKSYVHRIGRTARGGSKGTAISLVLPENESLLDHLQDIQPPLLSLNETAVPQPALLQFDLGEIDCFRYRVEDVRRAVTNIGIREARLQDVKNELLNSEKLRAHFEDNPKDLNILQHDKAVGSARVQPHLAHIPTYLVPTALQAIPVIKKRKNMSSGNTNPQRRLDNDPLHTFTATDRLVDPNTSDIGVSTAGRQKWKAKHKKGHFNPKTQRKMAKKDATGFAH